jgi:hypothetical protein
MTRRLLNLLTAVTLVLCVAVVGLWVWSYWPPVEWVYLAPSRRWLVAARGVDGAYSIEWSNDGIEVPCFFPFLLLVAWPCVAAAMHWRRRRGGRGFEVDTSKGPGHV